MSTHPSQGQLPDVAMLQIPASDPTPVSILSLSAEINLALLHAAAASSLQDLANLASVNGTLFSVYTDSKDRLLRPFCLAEFPSENTFHRVYAVWKLLRTARTQPFTEAEVANILEEILEGKRAPTASLVHRLIKFHRLCKHRDLDFFDSGNVWWIIKACLSSRAPDLSGSVTSVRRLYNHMVALVCHEIGFGCPAYDFGWAVIKWRDAFFSMFRHGFDDQTAINFLHDAMECVFPQALLRDYVFGTKETGDEVSTLVYELRRRYLANREKPDAAYRTSRGNGRGRRATSRR